MGQTSVRPDFQKEQLLDDLGDDAGADGTTAFTDGEAQTFFHGDRGNQLHRHGDVVARHDHFGAFRQLDGAGHVGRTEVELRPIAVEERGVTTAFVLGQDVDFGGEVGVRGDGTRLAQHLTTLDVFTLGAAQQSADVVAGLTLVEQLAEHFNTGAGGLDGRANTDDFDFFANLDDATLDTTGYNGAAAGDREDVLNRHQERLINGTFRGRDVGVEGVGQTEDRRFADFGLVAFEGLQRGSVDDRSVVAREVVLGEQFAQFHFDQLEQLGVVHHVALVHEHQHVRHAHLAGQQDVFAGLRHRAVSSGADEDGAVHLGSTGNHVLDVVGVARAVNVGVVTVGGFVFDVGGVDGDTARLFFRCSVNFIVLLGGAAELGRQHGRDRSRQRGPAVGNVTNRPHVHVRFRTLEFFLSHYQFSRLLLVTDGLSDVLRRFGVMLEFHRVGGATLRKGAQRGGIAEHFGQRHFRLDNLDTTRLVFHALDDAAAGGQVTHDVTHVVFRGFDFNRHHRLEQRRAGLLHAFLESHGSSHAERVFVRVNVVVRTVEQRELDVHDRETGQHAAGNSILQALVDRRDEFAGNH